MRVPCSNMRFRPHYSILYTMEQMADSCQFLVENSSGNLELIYDLQIQARRTAGMFRSHGAPNLASGPAELRVAHYRPPLRRELQVLGMAAYLRHPQSWWRSVWVTKIVWPESWILLRDGTGAPLASVTASGKLYIVPTGVYSLERIGRKYDAERVDLDEALAKLPTYSSSGRGIHLHTSGTCVGTSQALCLPRLLDVNAARQVR